MSREKTEKKKIKTNKKNQDQVIEYYIRQLHIDLKRALTSYVLMFILKIRPHYSFEIRKKAIEIGTLISNISGVDEPKIIIAPKVIYDNFKKLEKKGLVGSYLKKSEVGPDRKYYYLTALGERLFDEAVIKILYPRLLLFITAVDNGIKELNGIAEPARKETKKLHSLINDIFNS